MDVLLRLSWALPLVLIVGFGAVLILRRFVAPARTDAQASLRVCLQESLSLSDETRVYLIEVDRKPLLIVESVKNTTVESVRPEWNEAVRAPKPAQPTWLRHWNRDRPR